MELEQARHPVISVFSLDLKDSKSPKHLRDLSHLLELTCQVAEVSRALAALVEQVLQQVSTLTAPISTEVDRGPY
jgi:hypothetical protein